MGRGDKKTAKGKRAMGSYGNTRKKKTASAPPAPKVKAEAPAKKAAPKKEAAPKATSKKTTTAKKATSKKSEE